MNNILFPIILLLARSEVDAYTTSPLHSKPYINHHRAILNSNIVSSSSFIHKEITNARRRRRCSILCMSPPLYSPAWIPPRKIFDDDIFSTDDDREELERRSIAYLADVIRKKLPGRDREDNDDDDDDDDDEVNISQNNKLAAHLAKGRFLDLTCTLEGEKILENLIANGDDNEDEEVIRGAILALQSLLVMGMQTGVKGSPAFQKRMVSHLLSPNASSNAKRFDRNLNDLLDEWDCEDIRKLKHDRDATAGTQLLAALKRKRTAQGAFELLVALGVWKKHEDLALLRSGFPTRFTDWEEDAAKEAEQSTRDPDQILGIRKDLRRLKVYTIDNASTNEIDDGLSVEVLTNDDGSVRQRYWIHIADADRWAPRGSDILKAARRRTTSIYLPTGPLPMFPSRVSVYCMSLNAQLDTCALSLGVELLPDGSIDPSSIIITPSLIRVAYRLTYDDVDEMLEEGVGYNEEWHLGAMLSAATRRRAYRSKNGSSEGLIPNPIPQATIMVFNDDDAEDGLSISFSVDVSHNAGVNSTTTATDVSSSGGSSVSYAAPVSPGNLLVTEMMILAGEALGKWGLMRASDDELYLNGNGMLLPNELSFPYRSQKKPDFYSNENDTLMFDMLKRSNKGNGLCAAWFARRFFSPVKVSEQVLPHSGMGLDCYVQWTSPIRRYGDLQVHAMVKRYLRRKRLNELLKNGEPIPSDIQGTDIGCSVPHNEGNATENEWRTADLNGEATETISPINFQEGLGFFQAARPLQRSSQMYWMMEYIRRTVTNNATNNIAFECTVLGCIDSSRNQYVIYAHELGLEHRYVSEMGRLEIGQTLWLKVSSVIPRMGLLTFTLAPKDDGVSARVTSERTA